MYYCKRCNVRVNGTNETCPLCKAPMEGVAEPFPPYPEKKATRSKNRPITFTGVYVSLAILVLIICFALNFALPHRYIWSVFALILILYGYFTLKTTVFYKGPHGAKVFSQTLCLCVIFITAQYVFRTGEWAFAYAIPATVVISLALHLLFVGVFHKRRGNSFFRYMWLTCLLGALPAITVLAGVCTKIILPMIAFGISMITLMFLIAFTGRTIADEIRKKSHI